MTRRYYDKDDYDEPRVEEAIEADQEFRWLLRQAEAKKQGRCACANCSRKEGGICLSKLILGKS